MVRRLTFDLATSSMAHPVSANEVHLTLWLRLFGARMILDISVQIQERVRCMNSAGRVRRVSVSRKGRSRAILFLSCHGHVIRERFKRRWRCRIILCLNPRCNLTSPQISLLQHLEAPQLNCLNESSEHTLKSILSSKKPNATSAYLLSDADEQLLLNIPVSSFNYHI
jgi:hypothetical protein